MATTLPLGQMSTDEKLMAMDQIWDDLMRNPDDVPTPDWHNDVLNARADRIKNGEATFVDWEEAKLQLRNITN